MNPGEIVREQFGEYSKEIDRGLEALFASSPSLPMYQHMAYFMGFADEDLRPTHIYGGKRFRSSLALMLGDWYNCKEMVLPAAIAIEVFHNFTLIHDDIVDGDDLRRGRPTVWKLFGEDHAINSGDAQLLLALQQITDADALSPEQKALAQSFLLKQFLRVAEGQFFDFTLTGLPLSDERVTVDAYLTMVGRKTADLVAASTTVPGVIAGVSTEEQEQLFSFGYNLGMAYQLCDDLVSIWGTNEQTGKREYGDLLEKKKTLPVLWLYDRLSEREREEVASLYELPTPLTDEQAAVVIEKMDREDMYHVVYEESMAYAAKAQAAVEVLSLNAAQTVSLQSFVTLLLPDIKNQ